MANSYLKIMQDNNQAHSEKQQQQKIKRRALLGGAMAAATIAMVKTVSGQLVPAAVPLPADIPADPTKVLGPPPGSLSTKSGFEQLVKTTSDTSSRTPLHQLHGMITPSELHFERHHDSRLHGS